MENKRSVLDVADFFLSKESMSAKKLQRLVYYAYSWTLAFLNEKETELDNRLFPEKIEAWVHGPVVPVLYQELKHYGWDNIPKVTDFSASIFYDDELDLMEQVWIVYGAYTANELEMMSHMGTPWINARKDIPPFEPSSNIIDDKDIFRFFNEQAASSFLI